MHKYWFLAVVAATGAAWAEGGDGELVGQEDRVWHFRIGPVLTPRVRVSVSGPRVNLPTVPRSGSVASGTGASVPADPSAGYVGRRYSDGYVNPDNGTADPNSVIAGLTWNWGADDVSAQYVNGRMEFHTDDTHWGESVSTTTSGFGSSDESGRDLLVGVEAMGGWTFLENATFDAAVDAGFRFYGSGCQEAESRQRTSVTKTRNTYRYVDSYDASGWTDVPSGSHQGAPGGPGRLIGATPMRREELSDSTQTTETYCHESSTKLNYRIWDLRLGPTAGWKATDWLEIRGGAYGLLGLVDASLKSETNVSGGAYGGKDSTCEAIFGMAFGVSAQFNITDNIFLLGGVEYDWWSDKVRMSAGGADAEIRLSDMSVSLALGVEF